MKIKIISGVIYLSGALALVFFTPPRPVWVVGLFIFLIAGGLIQIIGLLLKRKDSYLIGLCVAGFMIITALTGFDWLNTILLLSFFMGLKIMLK